MAKLIKHGASPPVAILDDDADGIPLGGVSLNEFASFIDKCGGEDALKNMTTEDVCAKHVKVLTVDTKVSYIDHLRIKGLPVSSQLYHLILIYIVNV